MGRSCLGGLVSERTWGVRRVEGKGEIILMNVLLSCFAGGFIVVLLKG